jgi:hypothetical protein
MISLPDQEHRRDFCLERGFPNDWVTDYWPATDLRGAERAAASALADIPAMEAAQGRAVTAAEVGCAASHRAVAEWLLRSGHDLVLVFEDDAVPLATDFQQTVRETAGLLAIHAAKGAAFVCHLGARPEQLRDALARPVASVWEAPQQRARPFVFTATRAGRCGAPMPTFFRGLRRSGRCAAKPRFPRWPTTGASSGGWGSSTNSCSANPRIFAQDEVVESTIGPRESTPNLSATASVVFRSERSCVRMNRLSDF